MRDVAGCKVALQSLPCLKIDDTFYKQAESMSHMYYEDYLANVQGVPRNITVAGRIEGRLWLFRSKILKLIIMK